MWKRAICSLLLGTLCILFSAISFAEAAKSAVPQGEKPTHIELVLILDKSGSMHGLEDDTIGGFNAMIEKQKKLDVGVYVTTVLFNNEMKTLYAHKNIHLVKPMTKEEYTTDGTTALLDAVGNTILKMEQTKGVAGKGTKVIFVIITDGLENDSTVFTKQKVKQLISDKQEKAGWEFIYLGANIDAVEEADAIGVNKANAVTYRNTKSGVRANYDAVSAYVAETAEAGDAKSGAWKKRVEQDASK